MTDVKDKEAIAFKVDEDLKSRFEAWRRKHNLNKSEATRKLLRQALNQQDRSIKGVQRCELWNLVNTILLGIVAVTFLL